MNEKTLSASRIATILGLPQPTGEQIEVIEAPLDPVIVVAGAGSGKTETMAARVVWLIANRKVAADEILGLTFTKKAASELAHRIDRRLAALRARTTGTAAMASLADRPTVSTYNAYAGSLVSEHGLRIGIEPDATLLTDAGIWQITSRLVETWPHDLQTTKAVSSVVAAVMKLESSLTEHLCDPRQAQRWLEDAVEAIDALPLGPRRRVLAKDVASLRESLRLRAALIDIAMALRAEKNNAGALSFGDQIALAARIAATCPDVAAIERSRFKAVLLDEYQDTSYAQVTMLTSLFGNGHSVMAVGDPHQSIYGWRGASASSLARFRDQFASANGQRATALTLSTSWRNDSAILEAANAVARPLRDSLTTVSVPRLAPRAGALPGSVDWNWSQTSLAEADAIATWIKDHWLPGGTTSAAVLCRARRDFVPIAQSLEAAGIPIEIVGLGGLLDVPEVADVIALLTVAHDPSRGDAVARLLLGPRFNIGPADVGGLRDAARCLDAAAEIRGGERHTLIEALDWLVRQAQLPSRVRMSQTGRLRLTELGRMVQELRTYLGHGLPEILHRAEEILGVDLQVVINRGGGPARVHLDALSQVASGFAASTPDATVGSFLSWLAVAQAEERGLDRPVADPDPGAVQLITVHGAKGLEWDSVAVAGLAIGSFPSVDYREKEPTSAGWLVGEGNLPYPLRGDAKDLPAFNLVADDAVEMAQNIAEFRLAAGVTAEYEERRLAYVALTRARSSLLVSGAGWRQGRKSPAPPSPFLEEIVDLGLADQLAGSAPLGDSPATNPLDDGVEIGWWPRIGTNEQDAAGTLRLARAVTEEMSGFPGGEAATGSSPQDGASAKSAAKCEDSAAPQPGAGAAGLVDGLGARDPADLDRDPRVAQWLATVLLAESAASASPHVETAGMPDHMSASALVSFAKDPQAARLNWLRPVPARPSARATTGTRVHQWIEQHYAVPVMLDIDETDLYQGVGDDNEMLHLTANFLASRWADLTPVALEYPVETTVGGISIRTRIDAIFRDPDRPDGDIVIDWKTGKPSLTAEELRSRSLQLAIYRIAWSRASGKPLDQVGAAFVYLLTGETKRVADLPDEREIAEILARSARY
ncbi:ATP-dependent helicase [Rarobacter incanus]|uniref:DNA 3'-5' helicase n=1 Tax=Rarobacter incanus TaxID=153494 RepID=A0A542SNR4_9MICO|nr:ATP-dependent DNA helicase [Rarobacter incanus]TQK76185.1 DNA helicase-2/ATP-dependent DNA helicase PcrA [Rarobacter incanus]